MSRIPTPKSLVFATCALLVVSCGGGADQEATPAAQARPAAQPRVDFGQQTISGKTLAREYLTPRPGSNVLVVSFDALRADALGCYGSARPVSPHLDAFAKRSLLFEQAHSVAPVTATSFATAWTGRIPTRVFHDWKLDQIVTLADAFKAGGYVTTAILNNAQLTPVRGYNQGFDNYIWHLASDDEVILELALEWLEKPKPKPFFAWIHFLSPHAPYDWIESSKHLYETPYDGRYARTTGDSFSAETPLEAKYIRELYDGEILSIDQKFGRLVEKLEALKLLESTIMLVTADHGDEFGERGIYQHRHLYEETVRIPLLAYHPDRRSGARNAEIVSNLDFYPTLLALAALTSTDSAQGLDLTRHEGPPNDLFGIAMTDDIYRGVSIRRGAFKLILDLKPSFAEHLFDLNADPHERSNLASSRQDLVQVLAEEVWKTIGEKGVLDPGAWTDFKEGLSPETIQALRSLGY